MTTCVVICAFLAFVNWQTSPHYWWVLWVIAGWGLNIALSLAWYLFDCDDECNYRNRQKTKRWTTKTSTPTKASNSSSA